MSGKVIVQYDMEKFLDEISTHRKELQRLNGIYTKDKQFYDDLTKFKDKEENKGMKIEDVIEKFKAEYDLSKNVNFPHNFEANYAYFDSN